MADPRRLLDDPDTSPLARDLLASAGDDGPSSEHRSAAARRLGIAAITLAGASKAGSAAVATAIWWKVGLVVVLLGSVIGLAVVVSSIDLAGSAASDRARLTRAAPPSEVNPAPPPAPNAPRVVVAVEPEPAPEPEPEPAPEPESRPAPSTTPPAPSRPPRRSSNPDTGASDPSTTPAPAPEPTPTAEPAVPEPVPEPTPPVQVDARRLAAEVALLDRARRALKQRDTATALAALDEHRREFHDGALVAEAEVVRIETLIQAKDHTAARAQAESFLVRFPKSPLVRRVRSLVENLKEAP